MEQEHRGPGLDHIGFKVESVDNVIQDMEVLTGVDPNGCRRNADPAVRERGRDGSAGTLALW